MMNGSEIRKMVPEIRRMRGFHLYDFKGGRFLDLFLDGGRALLGHKPGRTVLMMKNALEKGLGASYPGIWEKRLLKQLKLLYPEIRACSVIFAGRSEGFPVFRPFEYKSPVQVEAYAEGPFELLLPLPGSCLVKVVCSLSGTGESLPGPDCIPQFLYSGLCRAAADLKAYGETVKDDPWQAFDSSLWTRHGPWLYSEISGEKYPALFRAFLNNGILLSPDPKQPSCAPSEFTAGEIKPIKSIEGEFCHR